MIPKISLRARLFIVMTLLLLIAGVMILGSTTIQYTSQQENYHLSRLNRKVNQIETHLNFIVNKNDLCTKNQTILFIKKLYILLISINGKFKLYLASVYSK